MSQALARCFVAEDAAVFAEAEADTVLARSVGVPLTQSGVMRIARSPCGESCLRIVGALDARTLRDVQPVIDSLVADRPWLVTLDFDELTLLDSAGVGAIVSLSRRLKADGGHVVIVNARDQPLMVLKVLKLERTFRLQTSPPPALRLAV